MSAIWYMMRKSVKNTLLDMLHHPAKLIAYLFIAVMLLFSAATMLFSPKEAGETVVDGRYLEGIYLGVLLLAMVPTLLAGMRSGGGMFTMSDVNMLFVSPIHPKRILLYGLIKQMSTLLLVTVCLIAYGGMAVNTFGISIGLALLLLLGFGVSILITQLVTMLVYSVTNGSRGRIRAAKIVLFGLLLAMAALVGVQIYTGGLSAENLAAAVSNPVLEFFPVAGWIKGLLFAVGAGDAARALLFGGLLVVGTGATVLLFLRSDADYYEDVLQNAESTYEMRQAAKEGKITANSPFGNRPIKVRDTGLGRGWGASAFFYKHLREIRRRSRVIFVGWSTVGLLAIGLFLGLIMSRTEDGLSPNITMMSVTIAGIYVLFFTGAMGEWGKELTKPYLYLAPCPPFQKVLWASMTSLLKPVVESVLVFTIVGVVIGATPLTAVICMLLYSSFGAVFASSNLLSQRVLGTMANKGLILMLYMLLLVLLVAPGLVVGIVLGVCLPDMPGALMGAPVVVWNLLVSAGIYVLCRNTLHDMESM